MLFWLGLSLALNAALVWNISRPRAGSFSPVASEHSKTSIPVAETQATNRTVSSSRPGVTKTPPPFQWSQIESADYREYIANLRAIGCPEEMVRDIVRADLTQAYAERARAIWPAPELSYWKKQKNVHPDPKQQKELIALSREKDEIFTQLFGSRSTEQESIDLVHLQIHGSRQELAFLPPDARDAALQALGNGGLDDEDFNHTRTPQQEKERFEEKVKALADVLSPEELEQYRLRCSPTAQSLQTELQYFDCTPDEFKRIVELRDKSDDHSVGDLLNRTAAVQQIRDAFGDERAQEFEKTTDMFYINARRAAEEYNLPIEDADEAWALVRDARTSMTRIAGDTTLSIDARKEQLNALQDQTGKQLKEALGANASRSVIRNLAPLFVEANAKL
jgi:hypothetical protein